jgi:ferredoxin
MDNLSIWLLGFYAAIILISGLSFVFLSFHENEKTAAGRGLLVTLAGAALILSGLGLKESGQWIMISIIFSTILAGVILFFLPLGKIKAESNQPTHQVDEREIIFARARLEPGSENYQRYYHEHPEHKIPDDQSRSQPGLLNPEAKLTDHLHSAATAGSFTLTEALREAVDGPLAEESYPGTPELLTKAVKKMARFYGALDCGITKLNPGQIYSHIGRGTGAYGAPIHLDHTFGVAFTVEMDPVMTASAPHPPITMESARQYVESARVAIQLAAVIRELGYPARAHIDGNYRVIAPLVARDAGLGEIGRMGLLMTPRQGPRVRVGVVTTSMPLIPDTYNPEQSTLDFCRICEKCAHNCPSQSIPYGDREINNGVLRWKIDPESCYHYWTVIGTDCGRCMAVCPFSHPDNWLHNLVRWGIWKSGVFRRVALFLDDFFYGNKPPARNKSFFL